jgi:hypothetical protein
MIKLDLHPAVCLVQTDNIRDFNPGLARECYVYAMLLCCLVIDGSQQ